MSDFHRFYDACELLHNSYIAVTELGGGQVQITTESSQFATFEHLDALSTPKTLFETSEVQFTGLGSFRVYSGLLFDLGKEFAQRRDVLVSVTLRCDSYGVHTVTLAVYEPGYVPPDFGVEIAVEEIQWG